MDEKLLSQALKYHGVDLLNHLQREQQAIPSSLTLQHLDSRHQREAEIKDAEFNKKLLSFIARKSDLIFDSCAQKNVDISKKGESINDSFAIMPALEVFMDVPAHLRRQHFFNSIKPMDCVTGIVTAVLDNGLRIRLLCVDVGCPRDIDDLDIIAYCPSKELPKLNTTESALEAFQVKDLVKGIVLSVDADYEKIALTLLDKAIEDKTLYPRVGLITEEEFPVYYRRKAQIQEMSYEEMMESILGFSNPGNVKILSRQLGVQENASFFRSSSRLKIPEKEYAEGLRKWQSQKLSHHSVVQGVDMFKQDKYLEAMQHFNRALQIDAENVEALVARGALADASDLTHLGHQDTSDVRQIIRYANKESFSQAIKDFKDALEINPKHINAKSYLTETLLSAGKACEDRRQLDEAYHYYTNALSLDPLNMEAKEMVLGCQRLLAIQSVGGAKKNESDNPASVLSQSAEKLKLLIQEDNHSSKKKKSARSSSAKKKRQRKSRSDSSSSESDDSGPKNSRKRCRSSIKDGKTSENKSSPSSKNEGYFDLDPPKSYLPVTSSEYFSTSAAIPGLGSPSTPDAAGAHEEKDVEKPEDTRAMKRRDELLMAEREKFYKDNKERHRRFRPYSRSRSSSSSSSHSFTKRAHRRKRNISRSQSRSRSSDKGRPRRRSRSVDRSSSPSRGKGHQRNRTRERYRRWSRKRSRSVSRGGRSKTRSRSTSRGGRSKTRSRSTSRGRGGRSEQFKPFNSIWSSKKSPSPITGIKELDMYLGGARQLMKTVKDPKHLDLLAKFLPSSSSSSTHQLSNHRNVPEPHNKRSRPDPNPKGWGRSPPRPSSEKKITTRDRSEDKGISNNTAPVQSQEKIPDPSNAGFGKFGPGASSNKSTGSEVDIFNKSNKSGGEQNAASKPPLPEQKNFLPRVLQKPKSSSDVVPNPNHEKDTKSDIIDLTNEQAASSADKQGAQWLKDEELEKEIERRVQERLRQEELKWSQVTENTDPYKGKMYADREGQSLLSSGLAGQSGSLSRSRERHQSSGQDARKQRSPKEELKNKLVGSSKRSWSPDNLKRKDVLSKSMVKEHIAEASKTEVYKPPYRPNMLSKSTVKEQHTIEASKVVMYQPPYRPTSKWEIESSTPGKEVIGSGEDKKTKESLTELEKFLVDLKSQKKKQWIAEGKVKE